MAASALVENGERVRKLRMLVSGSGDRSEFAKAISDLLRYDRWREFIEPGDHNRKTYQAFSEFCQKSLECHPHTLMDHVNDSPSLKAKIEALAMQPHGGDRTSPESKADNISLAPIAPQHGTSQASSMRRLMKDRPDLADAVEAGEKSVNAAVVEAGWRAPYASIRVDTAEEAVRALLRHFGWDDLEAALAKCR